MYLGCAGGVQYNWGGVTGGVSVWRWWLVLPQRSTQRAHTRTPTRTPTPGTRARQPTGAGRSSDRGGWSRQRPRSRGGGGDTATGGAPRGGDGRTERAAQAGMTAWRRALFRRTAPANNSRRAADGSQMRQCTLRHAWTWSADFCVKGRGVVCVWPGVKGLTATSAHLRPRAHTHLHTNARRPHQRVPRHQRRRSFSGVSPWQQCGSSAAAVRQLVQHTVRGAAGDALVLLPR